MASLKPVVHASRDAAALVASLEPVVHAVRAAAAVSWHWVALLEPKLPALAHAAAWPLENAEPVAA